MKLTITQFDGEYAVARLDARASVPLWIAGPGFVTLSRTPDELSIVAPADRVPEDVRAERGWRLFRIEGPIPFETVGVAAGITTALAGAGISLFLISTFDTDYVMVKAEMLAAALGALRAAGFVVNGANAG